MYLFLFPIPVSTSNGIRGSHSNTRSSVVCDTKIGGYIIINRWIDYYQ